MRTAVICPSAAAVTASSPSSAPVGTMIWPPCSLARSTSAGRSSKAPQLSTMTALPASSMGRQMRSMMAAGAHSMARSACRGKSSSSTSGQQIPCPSSRACALARSWAAAQASVRPGMPSWSRRASTRPIVPRPAMATRVARVIGQLQNRPFCLIRAPQHGHKGGVQDASMPRQHGLDPSCNTRNCSRHPREEPPMRIRAFAIGFSALFATTLLASAQTYPSRPITVIVPFAAGCPADVFTRIVTPRMSEILGQQIVIENVGGAGGMAGSRRVADAAPDGYTFVVGTVGTHAQSQTMYKKPLYNSATDFTPVGLLADVPLVLIMRKDLPAANFKEFVTYSKANHAKMQFGSAGPAAPPHPGCVVGNTFMGTDITHVPSPGTRPPMQDLGA